MLKHELKLSYSNPKYWFNRTLPIKSKEWRDLRKVILERDNYTCNFCGIRLSKYLIVDHIDGDGRNNKLSNFRLNCPACDRIRHSGLASLNKELITGISQLSQIEIVQRTTEHYVKTRKIPRPETIDPNVINLGIHSAIKVASDKYYKEYRGFFTNKMNFDYLKFVIKENN